MELLPMKETSTINPEYIDSKKLDNIICQILSLQLPREILEFGNKIHPRTGKTNYEEHKEQIYQYIDDIRSCKILNGKSKSYILSCIKFGDANIIDINLYVHKNDKKNDYDFYFVGKDLFKYFKFLPSFKIISKDKKIENIRNTKGTNHSRWYPSSVKNFMVKIAVNLRLLELYLRGLKQNESIFVKKNNILGSVISFEIPEQFKIYSELVNSNEINSQSNPLKIKPGIFVFQKNGICCYKINKMIKFVNNNFIHLKGKIYPFVIKSHDLTKFYSSSYSIGITTWDKHASIVIKIPRNTNFINNMQDESDEVESDEIESDEIESDEIKSDDSSVNISSDESSTDINFNSEQIDFDQYDIWIIDPWKKNLKKETWDNIIETNSKINIQFIKRKIKDQGSEGSCVLCSFARILYILHSIDIDNHKNNNVEERFLLNLNVQQNILIPIPDFFAYLASYIFRNSFLL
jgi:hypothetical protein